MGQYYDGSIIFLACIGMLVIGFISGGIAFCVAAGGALKGPSALENRSGAAGTICFFAAAGLILASTMTNYGWPLAILSGGLLGGVIGAWVGQSSIGKTIPALLQAADELATFGPGIIDLLDADGDRVVSFDDFKASKSRALSQDGISLNLLNALEKQWSEFGHLIGGNGSHVCVLGVNDVAAARKKIRAKYHGWPEA